MNYSIDERKNIIKKSLPIVEGIKKYTDIALNKDNQALCIFHNESTPSMTIYPDKNDGYCFGCDKRFDIIDLVCEIRGLDFIAAIKFIEDDLGLNNKPLKKEVKKEFIASYDYNNVGGELVYQVVRQLIHYDDSSKKKHFFQRQPNGSKWINNLKGIEPLPYCLPELLKGIEQGSIVYIPEGCKDVQTLQQLGLIATCNSSGSGHWKDAHSKYFTNGVNVVVLPDNDEPGRKHGESVASQLHAKGCHVKVVPMPAPHKDVTDWINARHTKEDLLALVGQAGEWKPINNETSGDYGDWRDNFTKIKEYTVTADGNLCRVQMKYNPSTKEYDPTLIQLSNFTARISKDITKDDGEETKSFFEIEGFLNNKKPLPKITVESSKFASMNWIIENWGSDAILSPSQGCREHLRHAIQLVSQYDKERQALYNYTGWRKINDKWCYLHAGGAIGADGVTVDLSNEGNLARYILPTIGDEIESFKMALNLLDVAKYKITVPLLALTYLTPLCEPLRQAGHEPDFVMWVQGMTQSMKSSLSAVILNHFGKGFTKNTMPASFKDTYVYTDRNGFLLKDNLLVIDDFHPSTSKAESQKMHTMAQKILRAWGDRIGRGRGNVDGSVRRTYPPRGMCLVTGEDLPEVGQSGMGRYFLVSIKRGDIDKKKLSELQNNTDLLAQNMANYINWLIPQIEDIAKVAGRGLGQLRDTFTQCNKLDGRIPETLAFLCLGFDMFLRYGVSIGAITETQQAEIFTNGQNALIELSCSHTENIKEEQPVTKFLTALNVMVDVNDVEIINIADIPKEGTPVIGYREVGAECYYLIPDATYSALVQFYNKQDAKFPVSKSTLWQNLGNDGLIEVDIKGGKTAKMKKIHGKAGRYIWLKTSCLNAVCDDEKEGDDNDN